MFRMLMFAVFVIIGGSFFDKVSAQFEDSTTLDSFNNLPELSSSDLRIVVGDFGWSYLYLYGGEAIEVRFDRQQRYNEPFEIRYIPPEEIAREVALIGSHWYLLGYNPSVVKDVSVSAHPELERFVRMNFDQARESSDNWEPITGIDPDGLIHFAGESYRTQPMPKNTAGRIVYRLWLIGFSAGVVFVAGGSPVAALQLFISYLVQIGAPVSRLDAPLGFAFGQLAALGFVGWLRHKSIEQGRRGQLSFGRGSDMLRISRYIFAYSSSLFGGMGLYMGCAAGLRALGVPVP